MLDNVVEAARGADLEETKGDIASTRYRGLSGGGRGTSGKNTASSLRRWAKKSRCCS